MWTVWTVDKHSLHYPEKRPKNKIFLIIDFYYIIINIFIYNILYI